MSAIDWLDCNPVWAGWLCGVVSGLGFALLFRGLFG